MARPDKREASDVNLKWLLIATGLLTGLGIVMFVGLWGLLGAFELVGGTAGQYPTHPAPPAHFQQAEETRLRLEDARKRLATRGPGDRPGRQHIPIEQAIDALVRQGWPSPKPSAPSAKPSGAKPSGAKP